MGLSAAFKGAVPLTLASAAFNCAKGLIIGASRSGGEDDEDELLTSPDL